MIQRVIQMQRYFILINFILLIFMIISKVVIMKSHGKEPIKFAKTHKSTMALAKIARALLLQGFQALGPAVARLQRLF